jgi:hypothetical protein
MIHATIYFSQDRLAAFGDQQPRLDSRDQAANMSRRLETWHGRDAVTLADERRKGEKTVNTNIDLNRRASPTCEGLGVKFPGPTRHERRFGSHPPTVRFALHCGPLAALPRTAAGGHNPTLAPEKKARRPFGR